MSHLSEVTWYGLLNHLTGFVLFLISRWNGVHHLVLATESFDWVCFRFNELFD